VTTIPLSGLVGEHVLTGIDFDTKQIERLGDRSAISHVINFTLDGVTYSGVEDPSDGYRSMLEGLFKSDAPTKNTFPPLRVLARLRETTEYNGRASVLQLIDCVTGKLVMEVGTDDDDDYYPSFVAAYWPENMAFNQEKK